MTQPIHPVLNKVADLVADAVADHGIYLNERIAVIAARAAIQALMEPDGLRSMLEENGWTFSEAWDAADTISAAFRSLVEGEGE